MSYDAGLDVLGARGGGGHGGHGGHGGRGGRRGGFFGRGFPYFPIPYYGRDADEYLDEALAVDQAAADLEEQKAVLEDRVDTSAEVLGAYDIEAAQRKMNDLKVVTVEIARILLGNGMDAIQRASSVAQQSWYNKVLTGEKELPRKTNREQVLGKLRWHQAELGKYLDPNAVYPPGYDLRDWTMRAYMEANAAEEGSAYLESAWARMWNEIDAALKRIPKMALQGLGNAANYVVSTATGVPLWAWIVGGVALTSLVGYGVYKFANTRAGSALMGRLIP